MKPRFCGETLYENRVVTAHCSQPFGVEHSHCDRTATEAVTAGLAVAATPADPFPFGSMVTKLDYDDVTRHGPFQVVRSYWPKAVVEILTADGMVRENHDRLELA